MIDEQVNRKPLDTVEIAKEIDEMFTFNNPKTVEQIESCQKIQKSCKNLAQLIIANVPEGKEQTVAVNSVLGAALWASQGITRRQITIVGAHLNQASTEEVLKMFP
jgi:hypothetical protein